MAKTLNDTQITSQSLFFQEYKYNLHSFDGLSGLEKAHKLTLMKQSPQREVVLKSIWCTLRHQWPISLSALWEASQVGRDSA